MCMGKLYDCNCWAQPGGTNDDTCDADRVCSGAVIDGIAEVTAASEMECTLGAIDDYVNARAESFLDYVDTCVAQVDDAYNVSTAVAVATPDKVETTSEKEAKYKSDCDSFVAHIRTYRDWTGSANSPGQHQKGCEIGAELRAGSGASVEVCESRCAALYGGHGCCQCNAQVRYVKHTHTHTCTCIPTGVYMQ